MTNKLKFSALVATAALLLREHMQAWLQALSERALSEQVRDLAAAPQRVIPSEDMSIRQVMDRAGASPKGRRSLQAKLFRLMTDRAITSGVALRRDPHSLTRVWLFPVDFVADCMAEFGDAMVAEHNAAICAQGVLPFKKPVAKKSRSNPYRRM